MSESKQIEKEAIESLIHLNLCGQIVVSFEKALEASFVQLAVVHGLGANIFLKVKREKIVGISEEHIDLWKRNYFQISLQFQQKLKVFLEIQELFKQNNIPIVALKGIALAISLYDDEGVRPMGDIDILVPEGKAMEALKLLKNAGAIQAYTPRSVIHEKAHSHVRAVNYNGVLVEIHQRLFALGNRFYVDTNACFDNTKSIMYQMKNILVLNDLYMAYHLICHLAYNVKNEGLRLGWLLDIALLLNKQNNLLDFVQEVLSFKSALRKEILDVIKMASLFLCVEKQKCILKDNDEEQYTHLVEKYVKLRENKVMYKITNVKEIFSVPGWSNKLQLLWYELFPSKEYMCEWNGNRKECLLKLHIKRLLNVRR
nr:nucleotidyltransferase family protein [uncultured Carboxylicivirga sp.]